MNLDKAAYRDFHRRKDTPSQTIIVGWDLSSCGDSPPRSALA